MILKPLENEIENAVTRKARLSGWYSWKLGSPGRRGLPDRLYVKPPNRVVFIEFKRPQGIVSAQQGSTIAVLRACGIDVHVVRSVDEGLEILGLNDA